MRAKRDTRVRLALTAVRSAVVSAALTAIVMLGFGGVGSAVEQPVPPMAMDGYADVVAQAMDRHHCESDGFGPEVIPTSALVRTPAGKLRLVTFDQGWSVFTGDAAGTLVAVCLDSVPGQTVPASATTN